MSILTHYKTCVRDTVCFCISKAFLKKLKKKFAPNFFLN